LRLQQLAQRRFHEPIIRPISRLDHGAIVAM
jgi:hypothetical protein